jgi:hypothetical protein
VWTFPPDKERFRIATECGGFTLLSKHISHKRFGCLTRSTPGCVVIEVSFGDKPGLRIKPIVPESTTLFEVVCTLQPYSCLSKYKNLGPFIAQWTKIPITAGRNNLNSN